jgi:hypothetical protein
MFRGEYAQLRYEIGDLPGDFLSHNNDPAGAKPIYAVLSRDKKKQKAATSSNRNETNRGDATVIVNGAESNTAGIKWKDSSIDFRFFDLSLQLNSVFLPLSWFLDGVFLCF